MAAFQHYECHWCCTLRSCPIFGMNKQLLVRFLHQSCQLRCKHYFSAFFRKKYQPLIWRTSHRGHFTCPHDFRSAVGKLFLTDTSTISFSSLPLMKYLRMFNGCANELYSILFKANPGFDDVCIVYCLARIRMATPPVDNILTCLHWLSPVRILTICPTVQFLIYPVMFHELERWKRDLFTCPSEINFWQLPEVVRRWGIFSVTSSRVRDWHF